MNSSTCEVYQFDTEISGESLELTLRYDDLLAAQEIQRIYRNIRIESQFLRMLSNNDEIRNPGEARRKDTVGTYLSAQFCLYNDEILPALKRFRKLPSELTTSNGAVSKSEAIKLRMMEILRDHGSWPERLNAQLYFQHMASIYNFPVPLPIHELLHSTMNDGMCQMFNQAKQELLITQHFSSDFIYLWLSSDSDDILAKDFRCFAETKHNKTKPNIPFDIWKQDYRGLLLEYLKMTSARDIYSRTMGYLLSALIYSGQHEEKAKRHISILNDQENDRRRIIGSHRCKMISLRLLSLSAEIDPPNNTDIERALRDPHDLAVVQMQRAIIKLWKMKVLNAWNIFHVNMKFFNEIIVLCEQAAKYLPTAKVLLEYARFQEKLWNSCGRVNPEDLQILIKNVYANHPGNNEDFDRFAQLLILPSFYKVHSDLITNKDHCKREFFSELLRKYWLNHLVQRETSDGLSIYNIFSLAMPVYSYSRTNQNKKKHPRYVPFAQQCCFAPFTLNNQSNHNGLQINKNTDEKVVKDNDKRDGDDKNFGDGRKNGDDRKKKSTKKNGGCEKDGDDRKQTCTKRNGDGRKIDDVRKQTCAEGKGDDDEEYDICDEDYDESDEDYNWININDKNEVRKIMISIFDSSDEDEDGDYQDSDIEPENSEVLSESISDGKDWSIISAEENKVMSNSESEGSDDEYSTTTGDYGNNDEDILGESDGKDKQQTRLLARILGFFGWLVQVVRAFFHF